MKKTFCFFLSIVIIVFSFPVLDCKADTVYFSDFYHQGNLPSDSTLASEIYSASSDKITSGFMTAANSVVYSDEFKQHKFFLTCMYDVTGYLDIYGISNVTNTYLVYVDDSHIMMLFEVDNSIGQTYSCQYKSNGDDYSGGWLVDNNFYYINQNYNDVSLYGLNIGNGNRRVVSTYNTDYVINYDQFYDESGVPYTDSTAYAQLVESLKNGSFVPDNFNGDSSVENVESNENHMYFKSCDIGFAEPSGVNSYNSFGGAYFYIKYSVDDWVRTHINDYDLYFSSTAFVGSRQVNGSKRVSLDSDGCICIPFSDIFSGNSSLLSEGFVVATSNSRVEQNFYKSYLYSVSSDKLPSLVGKFSSVDNNTLSGAWDNLLDVYFGNWLLAYTSSGFTQVITDSTMSAIQSVINYYSNFKIQTQCYLIDNNDNRSGSVGRIFDLATGSDTSTDNEGLTNDNPFVDDSTSDDYLPDIPTENNNYPVSTGQNGTYIQNNLSIPSQYTVTYRDGVNEFIDWYNQDSEVSGIQDTVWGSFGVFRDNPAIDLYEEYFGFLPTPFKAVIFGCGTIGIVGGAACVLRKRLMK